MSRSATVALLQAPPADSSHNDRLSAENVHMCECPSDGGYGAKTFTDNAHPGQISDDNSDISHVAKTFADNAHIHRGLCLGDLWSDDPSFPDDLPESACLR